MSEYDPDSVMNYCNPEWSGGGTLSRKDIEGLQKWYNTPATSKPTIYRNTKETFFKIVNINANDILNIRYLPNPRSKKIGKIPYDKRCVAYLNKNKQYKSSKWVKITYKGIQGWVNYKFLHKNENPNCFSFYKVINVDYDDVLNIRQSSNFSSKKVGTILPNKCCVLKLDESFHNKKKWFMVKYNSIIGWVNSHYLMQQATGVCNSC